MAVSRAAANSHTFEVSTPSDREICLTRLFDAPRNLVFEAMTKPEHVRRWWGVISDKHSVAVCEIDLRLGGAWRFVGRGPKGDYPAFYGVYKEIAPPDRLVFTEIFEPYHARIRALLDARLAAGRRTIYVAMHSFTPVFRGESRAMQVGVLYNRDVRLAEIMLELLRAEGDLTVGDNAPYAVSDVTDYGVPVHAERRGLAHVEIEIRQDLIASEAGQVAWAARFARLLRDAAVRLPC